MCHHFSTKAEPEYAAIGMGICDARTQLGKGIERFHATARSCVLYGAGLNVAARRAFLVKHREMEA